MDIFNYVLIIVAIGLVFVMFRNGRKNKARQAELKSQMVVGADIMTNFGLFGKIISIDEISNEAVLEVSPGVNVRVHRQTLSKVVTPGEGGEAADSDAPRSVEEAMERANREQEEREEAARLQVEAQGEPEFGERVTPEVTKPARRTTKKTDD
jgi:preprotein translocase subunit YajC